MNQHSNARLAVLVDADNIQASVIHGGVQLHVRLKDGQAIGAGT